ncbi:MAG: hypothetical protein ACJ72Q_16960, partial [Nitrososphaeraceae archaeon]
MLRWLLSECSKKRKVEKEAFILLLAAGLAAIMTARSYQTSFTGLYLRLLELFLVALLLLLI